MLCRTVVAFAQDNRSGAFEHDALLCGVSPHPCSGVVLTRPRTIFSK